MTPRPSQSVRLKDGSTGTVQHRNPDGTWRVWFDKRNWRGDRARLDPFGVAKIDCKLEELEEM